MANDGFLRRLFGSRTERRQHPAQEPSWIGGWGDSPTGVVVNERMALTYSAVWACVRVLAESLAVLPLILYERGQNGGKRRLTSHPLYSLLHDQANPEMTAFEFRETLMGHLVTWGNAYAFIDWSRDGYPAALWPLRPDKMVVRRADEAITYIYSLPGGENRSLLPFQILHLRGLAYDGLIGYSPVRMQANSIALGVAAEEFGGRFYGNDARPGVILKHPGILDDEAYSRLRDNWETRHQGLDKSHKIAILEEGMGLQEVGIPPEDAQFLGTRTWQLLDIARIYRIPPHKIGSLERATFNTIEQMGLEFVTDTLMPWLVRWEKRLAAQLLLPAEREHLFIEFLVDGLLRGDVKSRYEAYSIGRQQGFLSANDIREKENMNPIVGGDEYLVPLNMVPAGGRQNPRPGREARGVRSVAGRRELQQAYSGLFGDAAGRLLRREANDVGRAVEKFLPGGRVGEFEQWLEAYYATHELVVAAGMAAVVTSYGGLVVPAVADEIGASVPADLAANAGAAYQAGYARRSASLSQNRLREILQQGDLSPAELVAAIEAELQRWRETRPGTVGQNESVRAGNYLAKTVYVAAGFLFLRWHAFGESCPFCLSLNGQTVGINENFLAAGVPLLAGGQKLENHYDIGHPPAHGGCDCLIVGG